MKRYLRVFLTAVLISCITIGCGYKDYHAMQENHAATKTYRDGIWKIRYYSFGEEWTDKMTDAILYLTVDVEQDMTQEDMLDIMDYYESTRNAKWDKDNHYVGERDVDYTCYAVFYRSGTDEEIRRIKYYNGKEVEIPEEEQNYFPKPNMHSSKDEIGETGINGPLP